MAEKSEESMRFKPVVLLAALTLPIWPIAASAESAPKTVQIYVPFAGGGWADGIARIIAAEPSTSLNRQFVIINQPGAGGTIGLITASKAPPDGDTLAIAAGGALVVNPHLPTSNGFDTLKEPAPVAKLNDNPNVLGASPKGELKKLQAGVARSQIRPP